MHNSGRRILVTGGSGFIGSALVKALVKDGNAVRVLDDNSRGAPRRLEAVKNDIEFIGGDIRDAAAVERAVRGMDEVHHLAFVNGTEFFYSAPELVLDVGVKGMINVIDACRAANVRNLVLASSSEVYQTPPQVPTDERAPLLVPDPTNPRYSYGGGKIISELMAINYGRKLFDRVLIFRPHNVYGPDMGFEHVVPQFALRLKKARGAAPDRQGAVRDPGRRAADASFCHVDDLVAGVMVMREKGEHLGIYHIGTTEEVAIGDVARRIAAHRRPRDRVRERPAPAGGTDRRCPDIGKLAKLGYSRRCRSTRVFRPTVEWYWANERLAPQSLIYRINVRRFQGEPAVFPKKIARAAGTGGSVPVECCQICGDESSRPCCRSATCRR